jgi:hypothetical protein
MHAALTGAQGPPAWRLPSDDAARRRISVLAFVALLTGAASHGAPGISLPTAASSGVGSPPA